MAALKVEINKEPDTSTEQLDFYRTVAIAFLKRSGGSATFTEEQWPNGVYDIVHGMSDDGKTLVINLLETPERDSNGR